jgi:hypothetical protein
LESTFNGIKRTNPKDGRDVWTKNYRKQAKKTAISQKDWPAAKKIATP